MVTKEIQAFCKDCESMTLSRTFVFGFSVVLWIALLGCEEEKIRSYSTPKPPHSHKHPVKPSPKLAKKSAHPNTQSPPDMLWDAPKSWKQLEIKNPLRIATYAAGTGSNRIEIVVSQLSGQVGTLEDNINRWRAQLKLPALTDEDLTRLAQDPESGFVQPLQKPDPRLRGFLFDIKPESENQKSTSKRMLVALLEDRFGRTWFIKTVGTLEVLERHFQEFHQFANSFRFSTQPAPSLPAKPLTWETPKGWKVVSSGSGMITVAFEVGGKAGQARATIMALGGNGGGMLPNLNRWRNQVDLPPLKDLFQQSSSSFQIDGQEATLFDLAGNRGEPSSRSRILVCILAREKRTWFFKMMGPYLTIENNKNAFEELLSSVRFSENND
jgi:hypothetical protein